MKTTRSGKFRDSCASLHTKYPALRFFVNYRSATAAVPPSSPQECKDNIFPQLFEQVISFGEIAHTLTRQDLGKNASFGELSEILKYCKGSTPEFNHQIPKSGCPYPCGCMSCRRFRRTFPRPRTNVRQSCDRSPVQFLLHNCRLLRSFRTKNHRRT